MANRKSHVINDPTGKTPTKHTKRIKNATTKETQPTDYSAIASHLYNLSIPFLLQHIIGIDNTPLFFRHLQHV